MPGRAGFIAFYVGLLLFDRRLSIEKVLIEGVVYYVSVAIIEELYVRGLLPNVIEKMLAKSKNSTFINVCALPYCFSSINGYADLTLYIVVPVYIIWGIYSFMELKKRNVKF